MQITDLTVEVRDPNLNRVGQLTAADLVGAVFVSRYNSVGAWQVRLANGSAMGELLRQPGYGLIVTGPTGVIISGPTIGAKLEQTTDNSIGDWVIDGADDSIILEERLAYPDPSNADVSTQATTFDERSGAAETVIKDYVAANISLYSATDRAIPYLDVELNEGRGNTVSALARFDVLQELLYNLATTGGIGYTIEQNGSVLEFQVYEPRDLSGTIRMDLENGKLSKTEYSYLSPKATRAIVGGAGEAVERLFYEGTTTNSLAAETLWNRRIEKFIDERSTSDTGDFAQKSDEVLVENGTTIVNTSVTPSDDVNMRYGYDWGLGDVVTVVIGEIESSAVVTEIGISIESDGVRIGATIGTPAPVEFESKIVAKSQQLDGRISNLERNTTGYGVTTVYQPTGGTDGTQPTFSGPAISGSYTRFGDMIHFGIDVVFTNITSFGTGQYYLTLPYNSRRNYELRDGCVHRASDGAQFHISGHVLAGSNVLWLSSGDKIASGIQDVDFTATFPFTLTTADFFHIAGTIEIQE